MLRPDSLVPVGRIVATHGVRGLVKVHPFGGEGSALLAAKTVTVCKDGVSRDLEPVRVAEHGISLLMGFKGLDTIESVEPFLKAELLLRRDQFPEPGEDEYYWCDLIGLLVVTEEGVELGSLADILETGTNDVYVVRGGDREYLVPAIGDVVKSVDLDKGVMTVAPLDGLLDL